MRVKRMQHWVPRAHALVVPTVKAFSRQNSVQQNACVRIRTNLSCSITCRLARMRGMSVD